MTDKMKQLATDLANELISSGKKEHRESWKVGDESVEVIVVRRRPVDNILIKEGGLQWSENAAPLSAMGGLSRCAFCGK